MDENALPADALGQGVLDPADQGEETQQALAAWLRLQATLGLAPVLARNCLEAAFGEPDAALARSRRHYSQGEGQVRSWIRELAARGIRALPLTAPAYPPLLRALQDPPPLLLIRGEIADLRRPGVAIVGARAATAYGQSVAEELGAALASAGLVVCSGLARGIDAAAHRGALAADGRTVAVLGCGPDRVYPPEHRALADRVAQAGAVVSELSPGRPPAAAHFPLRNRLISGLVQAVVVVEARPRSGSLITARHALNQGREVLVVPGPIDSPHAAGSNALLRDGARPVLEPGDVLEAIGSPFGAAAAAADALPGPPGRDDARLHSRLLGQSLARDELARELGWPAGRLAAVLMGLEIDGWLEVDRDGEFRAVPATLRALRGGT